MTSAAPAGRRTWLLVLGLVVAAQLVVLYAPSAPGGPEVNHFDKVIHAAVFAVPTFAALAAALPRRWVLTVLVLHAPVSEFVQWGLLAHRDGDPWDVVADVTGVLLGLGAHLVWCRCRR